MGEKMTCAECGMSCDAGEYHPFAACLMFKACHNSTTVRENLATPAQAVDIEAVEYVIDVLRLDAKTFSFTGLDNAHFVRLADKLSQAIGDKT